MEKQYKADYLFTKQTEDDADKLMKMEESVSSKHTDAIEMKEKNKSNHDAEINLKEKNASQKGNFMQL